MLTSFSITSQFPTIIELFNSFSLIIMWMLFQTDEVKRLELSLAAGCNRWSELTFLHYLNVMSSSLIERECEPLHIDHFSALWLDTLESELYSFIWTCRLFFSPFNKSSWTIVNIVTGLSVVQRTDVERESHQNAGLCSNLSHPFCQESFGTEKTFACSAPPSHLFPLLQKTMQG